MILFTSGYEEEANQRLEQSNQRLEQSIQRLEALQTLDKIQKQKLSDQKQKLAEQNKELADLKIEYETLGEQIDSNEILEHLKELVPSTSIDEVWNDYKDWLTSKEYTKQDLEQN